MALSRYTLSSDEISKLRLLNNIPIFSGISPPELHLVASKCHLKEVAPDQIVIEQDDLSNELYVIVKGSVTVTKRKLEHQWNYLNTLNAGDYFGEIALLRNVPRTARVTTKTACTFLVISGSDFLEMYQFFPPKSRDNIQLVIAKRLAAQ
jgi:CRP/FNR family cyclic AMP-dependent transcriptional regulator